MFFRPAILLAAIAMVLFGLLSVVIAAPVPPVEDVKALGKTFQDLRAVNGHFDGGEFNEDVDAFNGKKHQTMQKLAKAFNKAGVLEATIETTMGRSDKIPAQVMKELKGTEPEMTINIYKYMVFKWRGYHDYLWFRVDDRTHKVVKGDWYHALE
ncbi:hypothetical protein BG006_003363 [Podila minutissima]|uniref:Uncharacterized protein n=1 Tax=Podila minutissima TaxID=64525 RepID=A0A9P5SMY8_9FUNG|nr:hypothetical protein BG006_003363 [Podila minutissima]